jgi:hypothetical protein
VTVTQGLGYEKERWQNFSLAKLLLMLKQIPRKPKKRKEFYLQNQIISILYEILSSPQNNK